MFSDEYWLKQAILLAKAAAVRNEVPVGTVIVHQDQCVGSGANSPIALHDPTAHAEILALRAAADKFGNYRLLNTTLYVTLEPCLMCISAMIHARVTRLVFGAYDAKAGAVESCIQGTILPWLNHRIDYQGGVLQAECAQLLTQFFQARRQKKK